MPPRYRFHALNPRGNGARLSLRMNGEMGKLLDEQALGRVEVGGACDRLADQPVEHAGEGHRRATAAHHELARLTR